MLLCKDILQQTGVLHITAVFQMFVVTEQSMSDAIDCSIDSIRHQSMSDANSLHCSV